MKSFNTKLLRFIAIPLLAGGIAALLTTDSMKTFSALEKPALSPPGWLFPVVWTILYTLMGVSAYLIATSSAAPIEKAKSLAIYT